MVIAHTCVFIFTCLPSLPHYSSTVGGTVNARMERQQDRAKFDGFSLDPDIFQPRYLVRHFPVLRSPSPAINSHKTILHMRCCLLPCLSASQWYRHNTDRDEHLLDNSSEDKLDNDKLVLFCLIRLSSGSISKLQYILIGVNIQAAAKK